MGDSDINFLGLAPPSLHSLSLSGFVNQPKKPIAEMAVMTGLTCLELSYISSYSSLDLSKFCSPVLQKLVLVRSGGAPAVFLAPGKLQHLKHFHCEEERDLRSAPNQDTHEADRESAQQCSRLLELPHLEVISGDCKMFRSGRLDQSDAWQESEYLAQEKSGLFSENMRSWNKL